MVLLRHSFWVPHSKWRRWYWPVRLAPLFSRKPSYGLGGLAWTCGTFSIWSVTKAGDRKLNTRLLYLTFLKLCEQTRRKKQNIGYCCNRWTYYQSLSHDSGHQVANHSLWPSMAIYSHLRPMAIPGAVATAAPRSYGGSLSYPAPWAGFFYICALTVTESSDHKLWRIECHSHASYINNMDKNEISNNCKSMPDPRLTLVSIVLVIHRTAKFIQSRIS
jgi:hypothetical protein